MGRRLRRRGHSNLQGFSNSGPYWRSRGQLLRERLLKLGAQVVSSVRRLVVHLPRAFPFRYTLRQIAGALGVRGG